MLNKIKKIVFTVAAALALSAPALVPVAAYAATSDIPGALNCGADLTLDTTGTQSCAADTSSGQGLTDLIKKVINILSVIIGVVAVIMIIIGGLKYITSGGDSGNVSSAKNTIIYALVGLVIVALAQFIVRFVLANTSNLAQ